MAIGGSDGSIILTTAVVTDGLKKGLSFMKTSTTKAFAAIGVASAAASVAITKMATSAYADYEQLVGGVETLFKGSADKVIAYAENAFATTGQSANEYMQNVTAFSASLLSAVGGDTERAAEVANAAMVSISDNVNKMGSSAESVQLAFQGFAKQQYMLLDNLKLGYGGTKTEMERLLKDAQAITGVEYNIDNLADVYTAIGVIQEKLGIAGTTAREAESTISGSAAMMKAAWQNVLSAIAGGGDLDRSINNLVYSVQKYFENIVPVVERSLQGVGQLVSKVAPMLVQTVARSLIQAIPSLLEATYEMILGLAKGVYQGIVDLFNGGAKQTLQAQTNEIAKSVEQQNAFTDAIKETEKAQKKSMAQFDEAKILATTQNEPQMETPTNLTGGDVVSPKSIESAKEMTKQSGILGDAFRDLADAMKPLQSISFKNLSKSLGNLMKALEPFGDLFLEGLSWLWNDILVPMSRWTVQNLVPAFIDLISAALGFLSPILEAIQPTLSWFWNEIIVPMASFVGDLFIDFLGLLTEAFTAFSEWAKENPEIVRIIFDVIIAGLAGIWAYNTTKKILDFMPKLMESFKNFGGLSGMMSKIGSAINSPAVAIGALIAAGLFWVKNWNKIKKAFEGMNSWQKTVTIVLALAAAIAVLWVALSVGIAAAAIVAGLAALGLGAAILGIGESNEKAKNTKSVSSIPSDSVVASSVPAKKVGNYSIPKLATGAVIPPNKEFMAVLGDQKYGRNLEAPESLIRQIVREETQKPTNFIVTATGSMSELIRLLNLEIKEEQVRTSVF